MRALAVIATGVGLWITVSAGPVLAAEPVDLYAAGVIVTGQDNLDERARGVRAALDEVLARVSGDIGVVDAPGYAAVRRDAETLVDEFAYTDRKAGIQISDEQGTRDRSFILDVRFQPDAVDRVLRDLGRTPWTADRPRILVLLEVADGQEAFLVTRTSERGWGQRDVVDSLRPRSGIPLVLPQTAADEGDADIQGRLVGAMVITEDGYWNTAWRLEAGDLDETWSSPVTTFDRAIADGVWRSAGFLSRR